MNKIEHAELQAKYSLNHDLWRVIVRCIAYEEFESRWEVFDSNDYAEQWGNDGKQLGDISVEQVEEILDDFAERFNEEITWQMDNSMNNAILDVTGIYC